MFEKKEKNFNSIDKSIYLSMVNKLNANSNLMIDAAGKAVVKKPAPNQRCPCGSTKSYKKCACASVDRERTKKFIERKTE